MVPLSKSGLRKQRGFESHPLRQLGPCERPIPAFAAPLLLVPRVTPRRGRLVDYGAALEMRFGATRRGFESLPLRHHLALGRDRQTWVRVDSHVPC